MTIVMRRAAWVAVAAFAVAASVTTVTARGGGGGVRGGGGGRGGFSHAGPAAGGSFGQYGGGGRAGGGYRTNGPAAGGSWGDRPVSGSFPGRSGRQQGGTEPQRDFDQAAREQRQQARDDWQNRGDYQREDWQDYADDHYDENREEYDPGWGYDEAAAAVAVGAAVGAAAAAPPYWTLPCTPETVVVGGITYYHCNSAWYARAYGGGEVTYIIVNPPAGY